MTPTISMIHPTRTAIAVGFLAAALMGCGGGGEGTEPLSTRSPIETSTPTTDLESDATASSPSSAPATDATPPPGEQVVGSALRGVSLVDQLVVFDTPEGSQVANLPARTAFDTPTVVGITDQAPGWVQILVPVRPNDFTGWVRTEDVRVEEIDAEIRIDLAARTLRLIEAGVLVGEWPVAVGRPDRPTPTGQFFITDKLATGDASSVWGAHAFGISAYSDVLDEFIGGIGQIGVHGTNDPTSIGQDVSSGCIRLPNKVIDALIDRLPVGTPVHIT